MKRHLAAFFAIGVIAVAVPTAASAREHGYERGIQYRTDQYDRGNDWNRDQSGYNNFRRQFQHAYEGVQHGLSDGSFSRREARQCYWAIGDLRQRLDYYRSNDGYLDRREAQDLDHRLARLHAFMHEAHEVGHDERDYGYGGQSNGDYGDQNYGRDRDRREDHDDDDDD